MGPRERRSVRRSYSSARSRAPTGGRARRSTSVNSPIGASRCRSPWPRRPPIASATGVPRSCAIRAACRTRRTRPEARAALTDAPTPQGVILIVADTLRRDHLAFLRVRTPDRARGGTTGSGGHAVRRQHLAGQLGRRSPCPRFSPPSTPAPTASSTCPTVSRRRSRRSRRCSTPPATPPSTPRRCRSPAS